MLMTWDMQGRLKLDAEQTEYMHMLMGVKAGASANSAPSSLPSEAPSALSCSSKHDRTSSASRCRPCQPPALLNTANAQGLCKPAAMQSRKPAQDPASLLHLQ